MDWTDQEAGSLGRDLSRAARRALQAELDALPSSERLKRPPQGRWLNTRPDPVDFRDRAYHAGFLTLAPRLDPAAELADWPVRDQKWLPACTGMAVATAVDLMRLRTWSAGGRKGNQPEPVSARMLYEMGRANDEQMEDGLPGSSVRGVLRGFFHNGVCRDDEKLDSPDVPFWRFTIDRAKDARNVLLGVYARLNHVLLDYHAALNETGVIVVSARVHEGWATGGRLKDGRIQWDGSQQATGGHAFAVVGYTEDGFLIRNSWGPDWSRYPGQHDASGDGIALWSYDDWQRHVMDAWVLGLAVPAKHDPRSAGGYFQVSGFPRRVHSPTPLRIAINGHYLHLKDGRFARTGTYHNDPASVEETAKLLSESDNYDHLMFMVESGLDPLDVMIARTANAIQPLKDRRIYPVFVWWREDVFSLTAEILEDRAKRLETRSGGVPAISARLLANFARDFMPPVWRAFTGEAERCISGGDPTRGAGWNGVEPLIDGARRREKPLAVHFVAHGTGAVWLGALFDRLKDWTPPRGSGGRAALISTISLVAPVCPPEMFEGKLRRLWNTARENGRRRPVAIYTLSAELDASDEVGAYQGSFVELARRTFPAEDGSGGFLAVLGHAEEANRVANPERGAWRDDTMWFPVDCPDVGSACRSHRGLAHDPDVFSHIVWRILDSSGADHGALSR
jgi:hypothetical protein